MEPGNRPTSVQSGTSKDSRRFITSAAIGNFVEWYDFTTYAATTAIIAMHFFPGGDPTTGLIGAYALFGVTFLSRPLGSLVAGWIGDALGRRAALSVTLLFMGAATAAIGFLPSFDSIGIAAPILLTVCRLIQGLGTGGEYAAATVFVYEHSKGRERPRYISYLVAVQFGGLIFSVLVASILSATLGDDAFSSWGWRIIFILAAPFAIIGVYLRNRTEETPEFKRIAALRAASNDTRTPVRAAFRTSWKRILYFILLVSGYTVLTPIQSSYFITYLKGPGGLTNTAVYSITLVTDAVMILASLATGRLIMRMGLHKTFIISGVLLAVVSVPAFMLGLDGVAAGMLGSSLFAVTKGLMAVSTSFALPSLFPAEIRVTAGGFAYNSATVLFSAAGPTAAVWINASTGHVTAFSYVLAVVGVIAALTAFLSPRILKGATRNDGEIHDPAMPGPGHPARS